MGSYNTAIGNNTLNANTSGINNSAIGYNTLQNNTTGTNNTAIGYNAGGSSYPVVGSQNTFVGSGTNSSGDFSQSTALGYNASITGSNQIVIGTATETIKIPGSLNTLCFIETFSKPIFNATLSLAYSSSMIYYIASTTGPITSLTITSVPINTLSSYTFTFILETTNSLNYITAANITINTTSVTLSGGSAISLNTPTLCILQQITVFNTSSTAGSPTLIAITNASSF